MFPRFTAILAVAAALHIPCGSLARASQHADSRPPDFDLAAQVANARHGDVIHVPPGVYRTHLVIDKPLTLIGTDLPVIDGDGSGDIIEIRSPDVSLRGFVIRNTGSDLDKENAAVRILAPRAVIENNVLDDVLFGIDLREAPNCVIRGNRIGGKTLDIARRGDGLRLWRSNDTLIELNTLHDGRDAILWYSSNVIVRANESYDCRYGLHLMYSDNVTLEANRLVGNSVGVYLMYSTGITMVANHLVQNRGPSGYGIGLKEADKYVIRENVIAGNRVGIYLDGSPFSTRAPALFSRNAIAYNDVGMTFLPSARGNELYDNNFLDNIEQVAVLGRGSLAKNRFWVGDRGNFWSDYTGYDQNHDGIGDFVHESQTLFESLIDREPKLRLFLFSPVQQAIELVGRALPAVRPEAKFEDEVPLMSPVVLSAAAAAPQGSRRQLAGLAATLVSLGAVMLLVARSGAGGAS